MRLEQFTSSMVDVYYPSQFKEMSHFTDEDWIVSSEAPYAGYTYTPATSLPFTSPETSSESVFIRPRNSPLYGHHVQDLIFPGMVTTTTQGLGIETHTGTPLLPSNLSSPTSESMPAMSFDHGRRMSTPVPILPKPGLRPTRDLKRTRDESEGGGVSSKRRKRSTSFQRITDLTEEERLLVELKDEQNLPWKEIAQKFETNFGRPYQVPQLQMRFKRLRERMRTWTEADVEALRKAHEYWERNQFEIIASKMLEFGSVDRWPAKHCEKKWRELNPDPSASSNLPPPPAPQWLQDTPGSMYGTPLPLHELSEHQPHGLQTPGIRTPGVRTPRTRTP